MQQTQFLVVGLGIAGTLVSHELWKAGKEFIVLDDVAGPPKASLVAGSVINPVNINKWEPVANAGQFLPAAISTYTELELLLKAKLVDETAIMVFQSKATNALHEKIKGENLFISHPGEKEHQTASQFFKDLDELAIIRPVWKMDAASLLAHWQNFLRQKQLFLQGRFHMDDCTIATDHIIYKNIKAQRIIFCEGAQVWQNKFFNTLPFVKNRGEALLVLIPDLPQQYIYHNGIRLVPTGEQRFWCGSNYQWQFENLLPDGDWRKKTERQLQHWLKLPFTVEDHMVAERPTTAGQEILMGIHPKMPSLAILNGLGTKGFSAGPLLAKQLCSQLINSENFTSASFAKPLSKWLLS
ncbi:MAG: FAD-dependent oxidoreductase [Agriterribacter sp.]